MTTMQDRRSQVVNEAYYDEPATKPPPRLAAGWIAWVRDNLFGSTMDTLLTIFGTVVIVGVVTSFLQWAITSANWFAIIVNLRLFTVGRVETFMDNRVLLLGMFIALVIGVNLAAWTRVSTRVWVVLAVVVALMFILPVIINAVLPLSPMYLAAGQVEFASGSVTEVPVAQVGFIGRAGDEIRMTLADLPNDTILSQLNGFTDSTVDAVRNASANRLETQNRIAELETLLASDSLTERQRTAYTDELNSTEVPPPITETLTINQEAVEITILDGTLEPLATGTVAPGGPPMTVTLPEDGWYVFNQSIPASDNSVAVMAVDGIYPIFDSNFLVSVANEDSTTSSERIFEFERATDDLVVIGGRPRIDGEDMPIVGIINHQYKGSRSLGDYLRLMLGPVLALLSLPFALLLVMAAGGYYGARFADQRFSTKEKPRAASRRSATWLWIALPVITFILVMGIGNLGPIQASDPQLWGGLLLTMLLTAVGIVGSFPIGILLALGRRSSLPVVSIASTVYIEVVRGVPLITVLFMSMLLVPFVAPGLGGPDSAPYRAMVAVTLFSAAYLAENVRGGLQSLPPGQEEAAKALGLAGWQVTMYITLPQALRAVIPALVGQFIGLFKDTSLVAIVGLIDLTGIANGIAAQTEFQGLRRETYVYISIIYFIFSYVMSIVSRRIEASGSGAARRV